MPNASGVYKQLRYKVESTFGTSPGASGAQLLRRTESTLDLNKDTYQSNEIRSDAQVSDFRHGVRRVAGNINGELSPKTYADFLAAALRRDFTAGASATGLSITIAGTGPSYTLTRGSGSYLADGFKIGDVARLTAGSFNAANLNKNLMIVTLTATVATVMPLNGAALVAEGPIATATFAVTGKKSWVPTSGHTDKSFAIEHWYSDVAQSELYTGCKVNTVDINLPATGMATVGFGMLGKDRINDVAQYYTSPTAATTTGCVAAVNGILLLGGSPIAICTGASIKIDGGYSGDPVVGANTLPALFAGRVGVSGQFTAYFQDGTLRDAFDSESELSLMLAMTTDASATADFVGFSLPRIKVGGAGKSDGEKGIVQTLPFTALLNGSGGAGAASDLTTVAIQDSAA